MGMFSSVGSFINDALGGTSSAKKAQKYNLQSMKVQNAYEKEAAQNAHQWEVEDLKKAGVNPMLTAGTTGASADTGLASGNTSSTNGNILEALTTITNAKKTYEDAKTVKETRPEQIKLLKAQTKEANANAGATGRGGWEQFWLGEKSPKKWIEKKDKKIMKNIQNAKKEMTKREQEVTNKFDKWDY